MNDRDVRESAAMRRSSGSRGDEKALSGRLPFFEDGPLSEEQRALAHQLHERAVPHAKGSGFAGADSHGRLVGPWNILIARLGPAAGFNAWVHAEQTGSVLDQRVREVVMLTVAVARQADYAIYSHAASGRTAGLSRQVIEQLRDGSVPAEGLTDAERVAQQYADELACGNSLADDVYVRALETFGQAGVLDLTHLIAIYLGVSALLGAFAVPAPLG